MDGGTIDVHGYKMTGKFQLDLTPFKGFSVTGVFAPNFSYRSIPNNLNVKELCFKR